MQLQCTQKLLTLLQEKPAPPQTDLSQFSTWSATVVTNSRRNALVIANDATRCGFVLYGLTKTVCKNLQKHIMEGLREMLLQEGIAPKLVQRYLEDIGTDVNYTTASDDRRVVGRLNAMAKYIKLNPTLCPKLLFQADATHWINRDIFKLDDDYVRPCDELPKVFQGLYRENKVYDRAMIVLDISLLHTDCRRQVIVPASYTLNDLHQVIQNVFEWHDAHLHQFLAANGQPLYAVMPDYAPLVPPDGYDNDEDPAILDPIICLTEIFPKMKTIHYDYDFGDGWEHEIRLNRMEPHSNMPACKCLSATGDAPPEDVGGPGGFQDFLDILAQPDHPDHDAMLTWGEDQRWQRLDLERINRRLAFLS